MRRLPWRSAVVGSRVRLVGVAIALVGAVLVFIEPAPMWWWFVQDVGMYLTVFSFAIAGSLCAVAGYVTGSRRLANATELARGVRPMPLAVGMVWAGDLVWLLGGLAATHAAAFGRALANGATPSTMAWSLGVLSFSSATMCYLLGVLAGAVLRHPVGAILAAVAPYALTLLSTQVLALRPTWQPIAQLVAPYIDQGWGPGLVPAHGPILMLALYCALMAVTAAQVALWVLRLRLCQADVTTPRPRGLAAPVGLMAVAAFLAVTIDASDYYTVRTDGWRCSADGRMCAWDRGHGVGVEMWDRALTQVQESLVATDVPDLRFVEGEGGRHVPDEAVHLYPPTGHLTTEVIVGLILPEYVYPLVDTTCSQDKSLQASADLVEALQQPDADPQTVQEILRVCR